MNEKLFFDFASQSEMFIKYFSTAKIIINLKKLTPVYQEMKIIGNVRNILLTSPQFSLHKIIF